MRQLVQACFPETRDEAAELWRNIKPIRFGNRLQWGATVGFETLASYQIPEDATYLVVLKTECYVFTETATAPGFRNFEPPPGGSSTARWVSSDPGGAAPSPMTETVPIHLLVEASEFLIFKPGVAAVLQGNLNDPPDANTRFIRTTVYAYQVNAEIANRIGGGETGIQGGNTA